MYKNCSVPVPLCEYYQSCKKIANVQVPVLCPKGQQLFDLQQPPSKMQMLLQQSEYERQEQLKRLEKHSSPKCYRRPIIKRANDSEEIRNQFVCHCCCQPSKFIADRMNAKGITGIEYENPIPRHRLPSLALYMQGEMERGAAMNKLYGINFYASLEVPQKEELVLEDINRLLYWRHLLTPERYLNEREQKDLQEQLLGLVKLPVNYLVSQLEFCFLSGTLETGHLHQLRIFLQDKVSQKEVSSKVREALHGFYRRLAVELPHWRYKLSTCQDWELLLRVLALKDAEPNTQGLRVLQAAYKHMALMRGNELPAYLHQLLREGQLTTANLQQLINYLTRIYIELSPQKVKQLVLTFKRIRIEEIDSQKATAVCLRPLKQIDKALLLELIQQQETTGLRSAENVQKLSFYLHLLRKANAEDTENFVMSLREYGKWKERSIHTLLQLINKQQQVREQRRAEGPDTGMSMQKNNLFQEASLIMVKSNPMQRSTQSENKAINHPIENTRPSVVVVASTARKPKAGQNSRKIDIRRIKTSPNIRTRKSPELVKIATHKGAKKEQDPLMQDIKTAHNCLSRYIVGAVTPAIRQ